MAPPSNSELVAKAVSMTRKALLSRYNKANGPLTPIGPRQQASRLDRGPPDSLYAVPIVFPRPPEESARELLLQAVIALGDDNLQPPFLETDNVRAEWIGAKRDPKSSPIESPKDRFAALTADVGTKGTIIYVHGGAFFQNGLATSRPSAARLSKDSGMRVIVLDYRLAPQHAFPSQILDLLILYLSLLDPPPGSLHDAIPAESIVLAGESCGGCIALGFLQLLLWLQSNKVQFHGQSHHIPLPAGFATVSNQGDQALCLPSWNTNRQFDIWDEQAPYLKPDFPADDVWPSSPPREDVYCSASLFTHPMVSPCTAKNWNGAPPMWFAIGQERLADSSSVIAQAAHKQGVPVLWNQYEAMPHCWMFFMAKFPQAKHLWKSWAAACSEMVVSPPLESRGTWIEVEQLKGSPMAMDSLVQLNSSEAARIIGDKAKSMPVFYGKRAASQL